jgi:hypothetical protein
MLAEARLPNTPFTGYHDEAAVACERLVEVTGQLA